MINVVTIFNFGNIDELKLTVKSILRQSESEFIVWFILSNAGQEDVRTIKKLIGSQFSFKLVLNQDTSLYNAMNIALEKITDGWLFFLNGGDEFYSDCSLRYLNRCKSDGHPVIFSTIQQYGDDRYLRLPNPKAPAHQGFLVKRELVATTKFQENLTISADQDWMLRLIADHHYSCQKFTIAQFALGGVSNYPSLYSIWVRFESQGTRRGLIELVKILLRFSLGSALYYRFLLRKSRL